MKRHVFCIIFLLISELIVGKAYKISNCLFITEYNAIQLVCSDPIVQNDCSSFMFSNSNEGYDFLFNHYRFEVIYLKTGDCKGTRLDKFLPDRFSNVQNYDISFHDAENLTSEELNFKNLRHFNASHNKLNNIQGSIFIHTHQLIEVDFSFNKINEISSDDFDEAFSLKTIILSNNNLTALEMGTFENLNELLLLDLSNNYIKMIENQMFYNNVQLKTLHLENNPIKRLDCNWFYPNLNAITVHVLWENAKEINANCMEHINSLVISFDKDSITFQQQEVSQPSFTQQLYLQQGRTMDIINYHLPNISIFNISGNKIQNSNEVIVQLSETVEILDASFNGFESNSLYSPQFETLTNLKHLNLSHTSISDINDETFSTLGDLRTLDLSGNSIKVLNVDLFKNNNKLEELHLEGNPIRICDWFSLLMKPIPVTDIVFKEIDASCLKSPLQIDLEKENEVIFRVPRENFTFFYNKKDLKKVTKFKIPGNHLQNTQQVIELLDSSIETLDLSSNFLGRINARNFERFDNLKYLNLSQTNLSNFGFSTFYHQRKLKALDLSQNHLKKVNFTLLYRNFPDLNELYLEGNELSELDSVNPTIFPSLNSLAISNNRISCDFLAKYLLQWHRRHTQFIVHPTNQTNIDGIECVHEEHVVSEHTTMEESVKEELPTSDDTKSSLSTKSKNEIGDGSLIAAELRALKYLMIVMFGALSTGYIVIKLQLISRIKRKITASSAENSVAYRQNNMNHHEVTLLETK